VPIFEGKFTRETSYSNVISATSAGGGGCGNTGVGMTATWALVWGLWAWRGREIVGSAIKGV
jgi:hypothetical protein